MTEADQSNWGCFFLGLWSRNSFRKNISGLLFVFERARAPRYFSHWLRHGGRIPWLRAPYEEIVNFDWSISRASR